MDDQPQHTCCFGRAIDPAVEAYYQDTNSWPSGDGGTPPEQCPACRAEAAARASKPSDTGSPWPSLVAALILGAVLIALIVAALN